MNVRRTSQVCIPFASLALIVGGCQAIQVKPEGDLPKSLIVSTPAKVGVVVTNEAANFIHKESRASVNSEAQLGPAHRHLIEEIFRAEFTEAKMFPLIDEMEKRLEKEIPMKAGLNHEDARQAMSRFRAHIQSFRNQVINRRKFILAELDKPSP